MVAKLPKVSRHRESVSFFFSKTGWICKGITVCKLEWDVIHLFKLGCLSWLCSRYSHRRSGQYTHKASVNLLYSRHPHLGQMNHALSVMDGIDWFSINS